MDVPHDSPDVALHMHRKGIVCVKSSSAAALNSEKTITVSAHKASCIPHAAASQYARTIFLTKVGVRSIAAAMAAAMDHTHLCQENRPKKQKWSHDPDLN